MTKISLLIVVISASFTLNSQTIETPPKRPSFGFNFGLNQSLLYNSNAKEELQIKNAPGFRLGLISEFPIALRWSVLPKAELSFNYGRVTENNINYRVDPYNLYFMTHIKYSFKGYDGQIKPYSYLGPNYRVPLNKDYNGLVYNTRSTLAIDFGFGLDIKLKYFQLSPELRFSGGVMDIRKNPSGKMLHGSNAALVLNFSGI